MDLIKHAYLSSDEFVKWVLSAGDFFPGFYRFTMGDRNEEKGQLTIPGLLDAYFSGAEYTREEWTRFCKATKPLILVIWPAPIRRFMS